MAFCLLSLMSPKISFNSTGKTLLEEVFYFYSTPPASSIIAPKEGNDALHEAVEFLTCFFGALSTTSRGLFSSIML